MRILILTPYYYPESVGAGVWTRQLAADLARSGHQVTMLTGFPNYPEGRIFQEYRGRLHQRETIDGVEVIRTAVYATPSKEFWPRIAAFASFCVSSIAGALWNGLKADVVYAISPPLPLGVSGYIISKIARARLVVNVQDIYPDIAVALGALRNGRVIRFFELMERWIYHHSERITVISEGFRANLRSKSVPSAKIAVIPNWADPDAIAPGDRHNSFREELGIGERFLVVYSGGLTQNSDLSPVLLAAAEMRDDPVAFAIVGEGVRKAELVRRAAELELPNVHFRTFQPLERYAEILAAADATVVALDTRARFASVPSKVYKQMAAGRPIVAITEPQNELARLVDAAGCGFHVPPGDVTTLVARLRQAIAAPQPWALAGANARAYLVRECSRERCVEAIRDLLTEVVVKAETTGLSVSRITTRVLDIAVALAAIVSLTPVFLFCYLAIRLTSAGPAIFTQQRLGLRGKPFRLYKFRSMHTGAPPIQNPDGSAYTGASDPRVTRVGRVLRKTSLDELPQLFNVLRGDMSLVGPRPDQVDQLRFYTEKEKRKLAVKPGITGLAQISGRNNISWERRKALDVEYVERQSFRLDISILAKTIPYVVLKKDIYGSSGNSSTSAAASH